MKCHPELRCLCSLMLSSALLTVGSLICSSAAYATTENPQSAQRTVLNRAVLTVGGEVFTAADAVVMLMIWNLTRAANEQPVGITSDWLSALPLGDTTGIEPLTIMKSWPDDVALFFRLALIWSDVQKLNLFVQREQDVVAVFKKFSAQFSELSKTLPQPLARQIERASEPTKLNWVESVLRVRSFLRVRGSLERNKNLFSAGWHWHQPSSSAVRTNPK